MKVAVIADIHANLIALQAVAADIEHWNPDKVIVAGDIVNRGPRPAECLQFVKEKERSTGWLLLGGNHEDFVLKLIRELQNSRQNPIEPRHYDFYRPIYWTAKKLIRAADSLKLPFAQSLFVDTGNELRVVHASMRGNRDGIYPETTDSTLRDQIQPAPAAFCVGHTHRPLIRRIDETLVANVGSVGLPFDGDTRAAYGRVTWNRNGWHAEIRRVTYDLRQAERDFSQTGFLAEGGPLVQVMLSELRSARSLLYVWTKHYETPVLSGHLTMEQAVADYLISLV